jgi:hypothetical protein
LSFISNQNNLIMKKIILFLSVLFFSTLTFSQSYQVVRVIETTEGCRISFLNSQGTQIYEVNGFDMTYNFISSSQMQIRDYSTQVSLYKSQTSTPLFDSLPNFLDSIQEACLALADTGGVISVVAGTNVTVDNTDPKNPIVSASGGGGTTYYAGNGIYIDSDTIKLGGNITEDTKLDNPNSKSVQIGSDGDAINLNVPPPSEFSGLISTYTGFDYRSAEYMSFIGILKGLNFAPFGFVDQDMVGNFTIVGNPFDSIYPDGSVMVDVVLEQGGQVSMNKLVFTFSGSDITFNTISMSEIENTEEIEGDNAFQLKSIVGDNGNQAQSIEGDNGNQVQSIEGDNASQLQLIKGEDGIITREINDSVNNARALEEITSTSYLFSGRKVVGSDTIEASNSISPNGFVREFKSGSLINRDTLNENMYKVEVGSITLKLDSNGLNYGQVYSPFDFSGGAIKYEFGGVVDTLTLESNSLKINPTNLGFYNKEPILQPILPLGSSTDDVIQVLQNLGLVRED